MVELTAKTPAEGLLPQTRGSVTISEILPGSMTSVAPFKGQWQAASDALKAGFGQGLPGANRALGKDGARAIWFGRGQVLVQGAFDPAPLQGLAAVTDQSDAWCCLRLDGSGARDVLARLTTIDLRPSVFKRGHTARTDVQHMMASLTRSGENRYDLMVMRSMAATAVHDLTSAAERVEATEKVT